MTIAHFIEAHQMLTGLSGAAVIGRLSASANSLKASGSAIVTRMLYRNVEVFSTDAAFPIVAKWIAKQKMLGGARHLRVQSGFPNIDEDEDVFSSHTPWDLVVADTNLFRWRGTRCRVSVSDDTKGMQFITKICITLLTRNPNAAREMISEAFEDERARQKYLPRMWRSYWATMAARSPRSMSSIVVPGGQLEAMLDDMREFAGAREWYLNRGIPYRRGYLLEGPPGTGKTSAVQAVAHAVRRPLCIIMLSTIKNDSDMMDAIREAPSNAIVLMEDIDCVKATASRESIKEGDSDNGGLTLGGLLNALDGAITPDGRITVMTTNYPERLDSALIRPGRCDVRVSFTHLEGDDQKRLASLFYGAEAGEAFRPIQSPLSPAVMQAEFMRFKDDPGQARSDLLLLSTPVPVQGFERT